MGPRLDYLLDTVRAGVGNLPGMRMETGLCVLHLFCTPRKSVDRDAVIHAVRSAESADNQVVTAAILGHKADVAFMALGVVALSGAWTEFYSRPQVAVLDSGLWLVSDTPASALWLIRDGRPIRIDLGADGIAPSGIAVREGSLYVADISGRLWVFDLNLNR